MSRLVVYVWKNAMLTLIERNYESKDARGKRKNKFGVASVNMIRDEYNLDIP
jgi:uncharacterized protein with NRDE domain